LGGTIGFFAGGALIFILTNLIPSLGSFLFNPIVFMVLCVACVFIGSTIQENKRISLGDIKEAIHAGVGVTFGWIFIWVAIGLVGAIVVFAIKAINIMPKNY
jgi:hypothetical protein